jgi:hypothetical protein
MDFSVRNAVAISGIYGRSRLNHGWICCGFDRPVITIGRRSVERRRDRASVVFGLTMGLVGVTGFEPVTSCL